MSIRSKIGWSFTALAVTLLLALGAVMYLDSRATVSDQVVRQLSSVASLQASRVESILDHHLERLALLTSRTQLRFSLRAALDQGDGAHRAQLRRILDDALASVPGFARLTVLDPAGAVVVAVDADPLETHPAVDPLVVRSAVAQPALAGFHRSSTHQLTVRVAGPLTLEGRTLGVLVADVHATGILAAVRDTTGLGVTGETLIAGRDAAGTPIYLAPLRFAEDAALTPVEAGDARAGRPPALSALEGVEEIRDGAVDYRGAEVLAATRHLARFGLGVAVKMDLAEAYAPVHRLGLVALLLTLAAAAAVVVLSQVLARSIARPLRSLTDVAVRISEGDRAGRAEGGRSDEVRVLAAAFNRMAQHLIDLNTSLEDQVADRTSELRDANRALETYTGAVSHDLRAPLRGIRQWAQALVEDHGPDLPCEAFAYAERIVQSATRMDALIDDLLAYSRASAAELPLTPIRLGPVVDDVLEQLQAVLQERGACVTVEQPLPTVVGHASALFHVLENLVHNAAKYVAPGVRPRISIRSERRGGDVRLWVEDNGVGVPPEARQRIFEPFERLDRVHGGTGIGLAIVRRTIERLGGRLGLESEAARGSAFWFELPTAPPLSLAEREEVRDAG
jgi:signal transduction histidine kinase